MGCSVLRVTYIKRTSLGGPCCLAGKKHLVPPAEGKASSLPTSGERPCNPSVNLLLRSSGESFKTEVSDERSGSNADSERAKGAKNQGAYKTGSSFWANLHRCLS